MNGIKKFKGVLAGFVIVVFLFAGCSSRDTTGTQTTQQQNADNSLSQAETILKEIGAQMSFTTLASLSGTSASSMEGLFNQGGSASGFDSTNLSKLENAIGLMQNALTQYSGSPKKPLLSASLIDTQKTYTDSDKVTYTYLHLYLGFLYTLDAAMRIRHYVGGSAVEFKDGRYALNVTATAAILTEVQIRALLDAWFMLSGKRGNIGSVSPSLSVSVAGTSKCAQYHFGRAIYYGILLFVDSKEIQDALYKLHNETTQQGKFDLFFSDMNTKMIGLNFVQN